MVLTSNTVIFTVYLGVTLTEHSPTYNTSKKWKEKWEQVLHKLANSFYFQASLPLHSAIQLRICLFVHPMLPLMIAADASLGACDLRCWQSICWLVSIIPTKWRSRSQISQQDWILGGKLMTLAIPVITTNQPQAAWNQGRLPSWSPATVTTSSNSKANIIGGTTICKAFT